MNKSKQNLMLMMTALSGVAGTSNMFEVLDPQKTATTDTKTKQTNPELEAKAEQKRQRKLEKNRGKS